MDDALIGILSISSLMGSDLFFFSSERYHNAFINEMCFVQNLCVTDDAGVLCEMFFMLLCTLIVFK